MSTVSFFTPISYEKCHGKPRSLGQYIHEKTDNYFYLGGKKAYVIFTEHSEVYTKIESIPLYEIVLKVVSYTFVFIPLLRSLPIIMLLMKLGFRFSVTFSEMGHKTASKIAHETLNRGFAKSLVEKKQARLTIQSSLRSRIAASALENNKAILTIQRDFRAKRSDQLIQQKHENALIIQQSIRTKVANDLVKKKQSILTIQRTFRSMLAGAALRHKRGEPLSGLAVELQDQIFTSLTLRDMSLLAPVSKKINIALKANKKWVEFNTIFDKNNEQINAFNFLRKICLLDSSNISLVVTDYLDFDRTLLTALLRFEDDGPLRSDSLCWYEDHSTGFQELHLKQRNNLAFEIDQLPHKLLEALGGVIRYQSLPIMHGNASINKLLTYNGLRRNEWRSPFIKRGIHGNQRMFLVFFYTSRNGERMLTYLGQAGSAYMGGGKEDIHNTKRPFYGKYGLGQEKVYRWTFYSGYFFSGKHDFIHSLQSKQRKEWQSEIFSIEEDTPAVQSLVNGTHPDFVLEDFDSAFTRQVESDYNRRIEEEYDAELEA